MSYLRKIAALRMPDEKDFKPECFAGSDLNVVHAWLLEGGFRKSGFCSHGGRRIGGRREVPESLDEEELPKNIS